MLGFSTVDGFMEVNESIAEMIKQLANEPSIGLFFVQQHTHNAVPFMINIKDKVVEKTRETILHTEDLEDSVRHVSSMKQCGPLIAEQMNSEIKKSLMLMSSLQQQKSAIPQSGSWGPAVFGSGPSKIRDKLHSSSVKRSSGTSDNTKVTGSSNYFSTILSSAKQRAVGLRWPQLDASLHRGAMTENQDLSSTNEQLVGSMGLENVEMENEELPISSNTEDEIEALRVGSKETGGISVAPVLEGVTENYEKFKTEQNAKLEKWLMEASEDRDIGVVSKTSEKGAMEGTSG
ncbi:uncharacterized protein LOC18441605 [Amborella trichopoda]|uniref:Uncharacterized protein n=1 Tax=Amborella trichopoda TaxID=13333 RepID=W1PYH4_AMBTC|nr:uncharacterized protein LOC18441605 [Amborella trichopoda]ERN13363.1 hypothetical protein AMTR_s00041p00140400 [Amborella trichopoda]|eukprot:XP_006851896.1 uncharacterized protein LOC18441605 [Amborella trichopoda]